LLTTPKKIEDTTSSATTSSAIKAGQTQDVVPQDVVSENIFSNAGAKAYFSDWYCSAHTTRSRCTKPSKECPSFGMEFKNNHLLGGYQTKVKPIKKYGNENYCHGITLLDVHS